MRQAWLLPATVFASLLLAAVASAQTAPSAPTAEPSSVQAIRLTSERQEILVNLTGGLPGRWLSCAVDCATDVAERRMTFLRASDGGGRLEWHVEGDPGATRALDNLVYTASADPTDDGAVVVLTSVEPWQGIRLVHRYRLASGGHTLAMSLQVPAGAQLRLTGGDDLAPERLPGFGSYYSHVRAVRLTADGQSVLVTDDDAEPASLALPPGEWAGVRSRFWALLVRPDVELPVTAAVQAPNRPEVGLGGALPAGRIVGLTFYAGPVERAALSAAAPELRGLLYPALWDWLRALSFGLLWLLEWWQRLVGNPGVAILLLSLSVKLLMSPLTWVAERWQAEVNRTQSLLQPELAAIKRDYRGEEAHERTLAVYRKYGVSPFHTVKSLAGFLIQIPVFIAAFDMLGENFGLAGAGFLWIGDLSLPDRLAGLPVVLPFFGGHLNLLPVLMTLFTVLSARLQEDASLSPELLRAQRLRLYAMAALFFVLLYTFPAGMVLYWTANNLLHLLRILLGSLVARLRTPRIVAG